MKKVNDVIRRVIAKANAKRLHTEILKLRREKKALQDRYIKPIETREKALLAQLKECHVNQEADILTDRADQELSTWLPDKEKFDANEFSKRHPKLHKQFLKPGSLRFLIKGA